MIRTLAMFAALLLPVAAGANPGALEINQDCVAVGCFSGDAGGFPVTITKPGSYVLTSDLLITDANAIDITVSGVDLDLNGHTIDGGGTCTGSPVTGCVGLGTGRGVNVDPGSITPVVAHVHNGTVRGFGVGILIFYADDGSVLDRLTITQNYNGALVEGYAATSTTRILNSQIVRNKDYGAGITNGTGLLFVENCSVVGNNYGLGPAFNSAIGGTVVGNRINKNGTAGIFCLGTCAIGQNTFAGNNGGANQYTISTVSNMGGNVCLDHPSSSCP